MDRQIRKLKGDAWPVAGAAKESARAFASLPRGKSRPARPAAAEDQAVGQRLEQYLEVAKGEIGRLDYIVTQFLGAIRPAPPQLKLCSLNDVVDKTLELLRPEVENRGVTVKTRLARNLTPTLVDAAQIQQVLVNLVKNASQAMTTGGALTLQTGETSEDVWVSVTDTGGGMAPAILEKVFEPFFTTKEVGKGTGLGLSQVYGFARQSGGAATITSAARRGTAITLFLPRSFEAPAQPREAAAVAATKLPAGTTALLVEDNLDVVQVAAAYFSDLGYSVKVATSAQAGLDLLESDNSIDLVFSDILMPGGMNGLELAQIVRRRFPRIVVLLTTGYSSSAQDVVRAGFEVVQKPYDLATLERALLSAFKAAGRVPGKAAGRSPAAAPRRAIG